MTDAQTEARAIYERGINAGQQYSIVDEIATALAAKDAELAAVHQQYVDANEACIDAEAQLAEANKDLDQFMDRLGPRWFLEQNWFPPSVDARRAREAQGDE